MSYSNTTRPRSAPVGVRAAEPASRTLGLWSAAAIITSLLIMVAAGLLRASWMPPTLQLPAAGPPWELGVHVSTKIIVVAVWISGILAGAGVTAGLLAARRGLPVPMRAIVVCAVAAAAVLTVVPPTGSTDVLDYAIYGHIAAIGRSPYVMTPHRYSVLFHVHQGIPFDWAHAPSVYGPLATAEELVAARLAGASLAVTAFLLKLVNAGAFAAVAVVADRVLRADPAGRARAHLLWTANPLLIWNLIAAGHLDVLAAAVGLAGLLVADRWVVRSPSLAAAATSGVCIGAAVAIKADYLVFAVALAWVLRRRPWQLLAATAGGAAVVTPGYVVAGAPAVRALVSRAAGGIGNGFYGTVLEHLGLSVHYAEPIAAVLLIPVACLVVAKLPVAAVDRPAIRVALALSVTWLVLWPNQFAWYSVMIMCVLVFYPSSRLDWVAVGWLTAITIADMPGIGFGRPARTVGPLLSVVQRQIGQRVTPPVMLAAAIALVVLCLTGSWNMRRERGLGGLDYISYCRVTYQYLAGSRHA
jgi:hypothetical protein